MPPIYLSERQRTDLLARVKRHYTEADTSRGEWEERHRTRYQRYHCDVSLRPEGPWTGSVRLFMGDSAEVFERLQAEFWSTTYGGPGVVSANGFGPEDMPRASRVTRFLRWALEEISQYGLQHNQKLFDALMDSAAISQVYPYRPPWTPTSDEVRRYVPEIIRIDVLDQSHLLTPPTAMGLQYPEAQYVMKEFYLRWDDILRMTQQGEWSHWGGTVPGEDQIKTVQEPITERQREEIEREGITVDPESDLYHYIEYYGRHTPDRHTPEIDVVVGYWPDADAERKISRVVEMTELFPTQLRPTRPFFPLSLWQEPRRWRGQNVLDRLESPQDLMNRLYEDAINYNQVSLLPFYFYNAIATGEMPDLRQIRPGSGVPVFDPNAIVFAPTRSLTRGFAEMIQLARVDAERRGHTTDFNVGRQGQGSQPRTAQATMALLQEGRKSYSHLAMMLVYQMKAELQFYLELWQRKIPRGIYARTLEMTPEGQTTDRTYQPFGAMNGAPMEQPSLFDRLFQNASQAAPNVVGEMTGPEDIAGLFDVALSVDPDAEYQKQVALAFAQTLTPLVQQYPLGVRTLWRDIAEVYGVKNFDAIWPEEVAVIQTQISVVQAQVQLAAMQQQLAQAQMMGASPPPPEPTPNGGPPPATNGTGPSLDDVVAMAAALDESANGGVPPSTIPGGM